MYSAKVVCDSIGPDGTRLISIEGTFPRLILAEVNTHKMISKSSASSRAIPVQKRISAMMQGAVFVPDAFGKNQRGMQSDEVLDGDEDLEARTAWRIHLEASLAAADRLATLGVHKQYANRVLETHVWHTALLTGTEWDNFLALRTHKAAQPEFQKFAVCVRDAIAASEPRKLAPGYWHLPYVTDVDEERLLEKGYVDPYLIRISAGRCARLSYLTQAGERNPDEDIALFERLVSSGHMSPMEHQATPMDSIYIKAWKMEMAKWEHIADTDDLRPFSGNFACWHQFRKSIKGERVFQNK